MRRWAQSELQRLLPGWSITPAKDEFVLRVHRGEHDLEVWLGRPFEYCQTGASDCEAHARDFVANIVASAHERENPVTISPSQLVPAIRSEEDVASYRALAEGMLIDPIVAGLFVVYMIDAPRTASPVLRSQLTELGLNEEQAKQRALSNLRAQLPPLADVIKPLAEGAVGTVDIGHYYTSSLVVPHADWATIAARFNHKLLVSVPSPDLLLYAAETSPAVLAELKATTRNKYAHTQRPLSTTILRWSPSNWQPSE